MAARQGKSLQKLLTQITESGANNVYATIEAIAERAGAEGILDEREREVVRYRLPCRGYPTETRAMVGLRIGGVTGERVRTIEEHAFETIQRLAGVDFETAIDNRPLHALPWRRYSRPQVVVRGLTYWLKEKGIPQTVAGLRQALSDSHAADELRNIEGYGPGSHNELYLFFRGCGIELPRVNVEW